MELPETADKKDIYLGIAAGPAAAAAGLVTAMADQPVEMVEHCLELWVVLLAVKEDLMVDLAAWEDLAVFQPLALGAGVAAAAVVQNTAAAAAAVIAAAAAVNMLT